MNSHKSLLNLLDFVLQTPPNQFLDFELTF